MTNNPKRASPVAGGGPGLGALVPLLQRLVPRAVAGLHRILRLALAGSLYYSGLFGYWGFLRRRILRQREVCVLGLHRVLTQEEYKRSNSLEGILMKQETFGKLLEYLDRNFSMLDLDGFLNVPDTIATPSKPWCLLTFDDGWRDNYTNSYPLLQKYRIPAVIFLVTGLVGTREMFWVERVKKAWNTPSRRNLIVSAIAQTMPRRKKKQEVTLEEVVEWAKHLSNDDRAQLLEQLLPADAGGSPVNAVDQMMTWEEAAELARDGIEMGAHTVTHPLLTHEETPIVQQEVAVSKRTLEERLPAQARAFAYPNGDWDDRVRGEVERAAFECAFTTRPGWHRCGEDLFAVRRILLHEGSVTGPCGRFSPALLSLMLSGWI